MATELRQETELRRTGVSEALPRVETALAASKEDNDALQNQLEVLKAASTSKAEDAETQQQTVEELHYGLRTLQKRSAQIRLKLQPKRGKKRYTACARAEKTRCSKQKQL